MAPTRSGDRLKVLAAVAASYLAGFVPLLLSGSAGLWWIKILLTASWPLAALAGAVSVVFSNCGDTILNWSVFGDWTAPLR
jgi:hypothetical protein